MLDYYMIVHIEALEFNYNYTTSTSFDPYMHACAQHAIVRIRVRMYIARAFYIYVRVYIRINYNIKQISID
jgi:hypothetical protein